MTCKYEELKTLEVTCDNCGTPMRRDWRTTLSVAPGDTSEDIQSTSVVKERLKVRPSGKTQIYY